MQFRIIQKYKSIKKHKRSKRVTRNKKVPVINFEAFVTHFENKQTRRLQET